MGDKGGKKDIGKQYGIDFPLSPTPSLEALKKFSNLIHEYIELFQLNNEGLSLGPIRLGTAQSPIVIAPIDMDPGEIKRHLQIAKEILERAIGEAEKSIYWTRKILGEIGSNAPEAEKRMQNLEKITCELKKILNDHRGFAWNPICHKRVKDLVENSFRSGDPSIPIQITILV